MNQKIVCTGFLLHKNKVLTIQRSFKEKFLPGFFELPGGKVDFGEDPREALAREFHEEVNLEIEVGDPYHTFSYISDNGNRHTVDILYMVRLFNGESIENLKLSEDHIDVKWIGSNEINQYDLSDEIKKCILKGFQSSAIYS
ncbi:NUDIX hydrolase [Thermoflavimicrobium daqui]|jgi:8-oxo-dGTP diphosphatase|uniref:Nudix hydrolase domain-containing protein n=1 Tax=Thermoflavimicrobium daqui TaxID=2137476 RepID=A0A364K1Q7_9BACL|nr:NUDIX domain-containing protein [Thermoflavimicrobium daqui]RAL21968.1 hypothetical protein DL897_15395 [Thermoflavimicrobium daqui]